MDVCDFDYTHTNNLNINEKNPFEEEPISNWGKIGEVYSNTRSQCLIMCTICVGYGEKFDRAYTTNDASAFWNHIQLQHKNCPLFNDETSKEKEYNTQQHHHVSSYEDNGIKSNDVSADSPNPAIVVSTYDTLSPHERRIESTTDREQQLEYASHQHETELRIDNPPFPHLDRNESYLSDKCANQIVDISDDEDVANSSLVQHDQINVENDNAIELSDDEEFGHSAEDESTFTFQTGKLYKCEICGELFIDQHTKNEHRKSHEDMFVNAEVTRTEFQNSDECSAVTCSNINDNALEHYRCRFCRIPFFTIEQLEEHQTTHISRTDDQGQNAVLPLDCKTCGKYFSSTDFLRSHEQNVHELGIDLELTKCLHCEKILLKSNLESHISEDHKQIDCPLTRHLLLSSPMTQSQTCSFSRPFKCRICGRRTTTTETMAVHHLRFHSSILDPNTANCEVCHKLVLAKNMSLHMTAKHGHGTKIKCPHCSKRYKSRKNLQIHMELSHSTPALPPNQIVEDSSTTSTTTQSEFTSDDRTEYSDSQYQMNFEPFSDQFNDEEEIISYGEVIPMNISGTDS